ncbi:S-adenosyl-L-methionine-dependent methyltransferase [Myxozyma melibiosi]|uniref:S-adenosyl-L-methionine-dependent methyltransferase n=1 Tax=Myxozyma melibiosi TaxID=54550 RepID=A0ABR1FA18_9ASCO
MADLKLSEVDKLQTKEYWDTRYQKDGEAKTFDWFKTFKDLEPFFRKHISWDNEGTGSSLKILMLGCGNSALFLQTLSKDLYDSGLKNITNVDYSDVCIAQMAELHKDQPEMTWHVMDVRDMKEFKDGEFDIAIDKGTLDAFLSYTGSIWTIPEDIKESALKYMDETNRVLKPTGRMLYISYRQPHFARLIIDRPYWKMETETLSDSSGSFDYFGYVLQK